MQLKIIAVGGTIDKVYFDAKSAYQVGEPQIGLILSEALVTLDYEITSIVHKDSLDMTEDDRAHIRAQVTAAPHRRIIITHGTDTMIETARCLAGIADKTVVLTGAMSPARFKSSDATFNIGCAVGAVQALAPGIYIVMNGRIFDPLRVRKNVAENRFEAL